METFEFYQDKKVTVWERTYFSVKAQNREKAIEKVKEHYEEDITDVEIEDSSFTFHNHETVYDTIQEIEPKDNDDFSTCQVYDNKTGNLICENGKKYF